MYKWDVTIEEALAIQQAGRMQVQTSNGFDLNKIKTVAGLDVSYKQEIGRAAVVIYSWPEMVLLEKAVAVSSSVFPYTPGLLSFREGPVVLKALEKLHTNPDLLIFDGQGLAHPRRFGLASHLGVVLDKPTIGCAKTRFIGQFDPPGPNVGDYSLLTDPDEQGQSETIGAVLRTKAATKPLFVSIGHKIDLPTAITIILQSLRGFRLPEPTRMADIVAETVPFQE